MERVTVSEALIGKTRVVAFSGEIDIANAENLREALARTRGAPVVVSLQGLRYIDSTGLNALLAEHNLRKRNDEPLLLVSPLPPADRVFQVTSLDNVLACFRELEDALVEASAAAARAAKPFGAEP